MSGTRFVALMVVAVGVVAVVVGAVYFYQKGRTPLPTGQPKLATEQSEPSRPEQPKPKSQAPAAESPPARPTSVPSFDVVRIEPTGEGVIAGRAEPGWAVKIESGQATVAETTADEEGAWSVVLDKPLASGDHSLTLRAMSPDGTRALISRQPVQVAVGKAQGEAVAQKEASKSTEPPNEEAAPAPSGDQQIATAEEPKPEETTETKPKAASSAASPEEAKPELPAEASPAVGPEPSVAPEAKEAEQPASSTEESKPTDATEAAPQGSEASAGTAEKAESSGAPERPKQPEVAKEEPAAPQPGASPPAPPTPAVTAQQPSEAERPEPKKPPVEFKSVDYQDTGPNSGKVSLTGTGDPGARILLFSDNDPLGQVSVGSDGTWAFEREKKLGDGEHTFRADRIDEGSGIVIGQASISIVRMEKPAEPSAEEHAATPTPSAPSPGAAPGAAQAASQPAPQVVAAEEAKPAATGGRQAHRTPHRPKVYTVRRGDTLWEIAESYFGGGWHYRAIVRDNRRKIHNPNLIYPRQTFHMPAR